MQADGLHVFGTGIPEEREETVMERKKRIYFARKAELEKLQEVDMAAAKKRHQAELNGIGNAYNGLHRQNAQEYGLR